MTHHSQQDSSGRRIGQSQMSVPDIIKQSQQTAIHVPSGIRNRNHSKQSTADPSLRPLGRWDRHRTPDCPFRSLVTIPTTPQRPCYNCDGSLQCTEPGSRGHSIVCVPSWMSEESQFDSWQEPETYLCPEHQDWFQDSPTILLNSWAKATVSVLRLRMN